jgi:hypothetical protein
MLTLNKKIMKLFKIVLLKEVSNEKPEFTKVYALSSNVILVDDNIPSNLGRISEKTNLGEVDVIINCTKNSGTLYRITNKYGKPNYVILENPDIKSAEILFIKKAHSKSLGISEERVCLEEACEVEYYNSVEELGKVFFSN